jgi:hypothetical protein
MLKAFTPVAPIFTLGNARLVTEVVKSTMPVPLSATL